MRIRWHLVILVAAALLPVLVFATILTWLFWSQQRATLDRGYLDGVRALTIALDSEINASIHTLQALALSPELDADFPERFSETFGRVLEDRQGWSIIALADRAGKQIFRIGKQPSKVDWIDKDTLNRVFVGRQPVVSGLVPVGESGEYLTEIAVPVLRGGIIRYAFVVGIDPAVWLGFLSRYPTPHKATVTLLDQHGIVVARTLNNFWVGHRPAPDLYRRSRSLLEGAYRSIGLEGQRFYTAHRRSVKFGWTVATGVPREDVEAALLRSILTMAGSSLVAATLALVLAFVIGRRIAAPISALAESAKALAAGSEIHPPSAHNIAEVSNVVHAFEEAGTLLRDHRLELSRALTREQKARAEAESASRNKDEFLAMLSHELRNPLNAIVSAMAILDRIGPSAQSALAPRKVITRQVRHLTKLVDDLLDVARVTSGKIILDSRPLNLASVVRQSVMILQEAGRLASHRFSVECVEVWTIADATRIEQIVANLVENSAKYTPSGGEIAVRVGPSNGSAVLEVSDTGVGLSADLLPRVFDLFAQGERTIDRSQGGLGLGLTLVRRLTELHGGQVEAASDGIGKGAKFTVRLPRTDRPAIISPPLNTATIARRRLRILVVDDNADGRDMLKTVLVMKGHQVHEAEEGISAVECARSIHLDVAIVDIGLPGFDGYEVARRIIAGANGSAPKLVALTGYGQEEDRCRAMAAGFDEHLVKPVDPDILDRILGNLSEGNSPGPNLPTVS